MNILERFAWEMKYAVESVVSALDLFHRFLTTLTRNPNGQIAADTLETTINRHFSSVRSLDDIFRIAADEWKQNLRKLEKLASKLDAGKSWQELYHDYYPSEIDKTDTMSLYAEEIKNLGLFFMMVKIWLQSIPIKFGNRLGLCLKMVKFCQAIFCRMFLVLLT